jgi:peptidoglycan hydrolase-like protein with peptidoglycan-binding domain
MGDGTGVLRSYRCLTFTTLIGVSPVARIIYPNNMGEDVRLLQKTLNLIKLTELLQADGYYGHQSKLWVQDVQYRNNLVQDGVVGPFTRGAIAQMLRQGRVQPQLLGDVTRNTSLEALAVAIVESRAALNQDQFDFRAVPFNDFGAVPSDLPRGAGRGGVVRPFDFPDL